MNEIQLAMTDETPDYKAFASDLADCVEEFLWAHAGGDDGRALPKICQNALEVCERYRLAAGPRRIGLKTLIKLAAEQAKIEGKDVYGEILRAIAYRSKDCEQYFSEDRPLYEDIREWFEYEATLEAEA